MLLLYKDKLNTRELICLLSIILFSNIWVLIFTAIPVVANVQPDNYYSRHNGWYTGNDVMRFLEPVIGYVLVHMLLYLYKLYV